MAARLLVRTPFQGTDPDHRGQVSCRFRFVVSQMPKYEASESRVFIGLAYFSMTSEPASDFQGAPFAGGPLPIHGSGGSYELRDQSH